MWKVPVYVLSFLLHKFSLTLSFSYYINKLYTISKCTEVCEEARASVKESFLNNQ